MKQTAVQEFALALMRAKAIKSSSTNDFIKAHVDALQMEKEQIIEAYRKGAVDGWKDEAYEYPYEYYNETFKSE